MKKGKKRRRNDERRTRPPLSPLYTHIYTRVYKGEKRAPAHRRLIVMIRSGSGNGKKPTTRCETARLFVRLRDFRVALDMVYILLRSRGRNGFLIWREF